MTFTDGSRNRYDLVVGADGISSHVRELVWGSDLKPRFTGPVRVAGDGATTA